MKKLHVIATCVVVCLIIIFKLPIDVGGLL
nr:hypothetical protein FYQYKPKK_FYQYKPKK_CDS_0004 [Microvirus sp.]